MKTVLCLVLLLTSSISLASEFYAIEEADRYTPYFYEVTEESGQKLEIAAHLWTKSNSTLVLMAHGYTDNCGYLKPLQRWFLLNHYDVLCIELPGHGESSGRQADVTRIETYYEIYQTLLPQVFALNYDSYVFYGHSTGNIGMIEYLLDQKSHQFDKIIMATPLIRSYLWKLSRLGQRLFGRVVRRLPKRPVSTANPEYKKLVKLDPHPMRSVPMSWFEQLIKWNDKLLTDDRISSEKIYAIFASKDTVIDYQFNKKFIEDRFPNTEMSIIEGSDHTLHYQEKRHTDIFYGILQDILKR